MDAQIDVEVKNVQLRDAREPDCRPRHDDRETCRPHPFYELHGSRQQSISVQLSRHRGSDHWSCINARQLLRRKGRPTGHFIRNSFSKWDVFNNWNMVAGAVIP